MSTKDISDRQVCAAYAAMEHLHETAEVILQYQTGQPEKVCWRAMERACRRDLIDYGTNLRYGWLTEKGRALLDL